MHQVKRLVPVAAVLLAVVAATHGQQTAPDPPAAGYAIEVDIVPDLERQDAYRAEAVVTDLRTGAVVTRPHVRFLRGPDGRGEIRTGTSRGLEVGMVVEVDEAGEAATYQAEIWDGEVLVSAHRVRVRLLGRGTAE